MRFSEHFGLPVNQAMYDFVDVPLDTDVPLFVDPYALRTTSTRWCREAHSAAADFFQAVLDALKHGDRAKALQLLGHLHEDNRTRTGYSEGRPGGTGVGNSHADVIATALENSPAFASGVIEDIEDFSLLANGVDRDRISDMLINVLHAQLAAYTVDQCRLLGVPLTKRETLTTWRREDGWVELHVALPSADGQSILLLPRSIVRRDLALKSGRLLTHLIDHIESSQHRDGLRSLEGMLKGKPVPMKSTQDGTPSIARKDLRERLKECGSQKDVVGKLVTDIPGVLDTYKEKARRNQSAPDAHDIEELITGEWSGSDASAIAAEMRLAARNTDDVTEAARLLMGMLVGAFHPHLQHPKPFVGHDGEFTGAAFSCTASSGFWFDVTRIRTNEEGERRVMACAPRRTIDSEDAQRIGNTVIESTGASAVLLVGHRISDELKSQRTRLAQHGILVATIDEVTGIAERDLLPEEAADLLQQLFS